VLTAPDAAAQLVQLGQPEAVGVLDQHHLLQRLIILIPS
jgi:hypothetical protein